MNGTIVEDFNSAAEQMWATVECEAATSLCKCRAHHGISRNDLTYCERIITCKYRVLIEETTLYLSLCLATCT